MLEAKFENALLEAIEADKNDFFVEIKDFLTSPTSKKLRPKLIFASLRALDLPVTSEQIKIAVAIELLHCASLIHDDIIDESSVRRGKESFYKKFGAKTSVILGDYLLSVAMKTLARVNNPRIIEIFAENMIEVCNGEISQNNPDADYIEIITKKTARLFFCGVSASLEHAKAPLKEREKLENFALNYGIAFQIKDDIDDNVCDNINLKEKFIERAQQNALSAELTGFLDEIR